MSVCAVVYRCVEAQCAELKEEVERTELENAAVKVFIEVTQQFSPMLYIAILLCVCVCAAHREDLCYPAFSFQISLLISG